MAAVDGKCARSDHGGAIYGPAFVGFLGGFNVGFGFGAGVGWYRLDGESLRPWYRCGNGYWNRINVHNTYVRNVNNFNRTTLNNYNYRYAHDTHAVTVAPHNAFANGQAIHRNDLRVNATLRGAHVNNGVNARPTNASYWARRICTGAWQRPRATFRTDP
jgi:hypothetical protein